MEDFKVPFPAYSALFRAVNNSMFINDKLSNKIRWLNDNKRDVDLHDTNRYNVY